MSDTPHIASPAREHESEATRDDPGTGADTDRDRHDRPATTDRVLVLDSDTQAALSVIRSLGRRDLTVVAGGASSRTLGMLSRYSDESYVHPDPDGNQRDFLDHLCTHIQQRDYEVVVPVMDGMTTLVARNKQTLETAGATVATEDWETFYRAYDKATLFELAEPLDVPCPKTIAPQSVDAALEVATKFEYPAVIKPRSKSIWVDGEHTLRLVSDENYVHSPADLRRTYPAIVGERDYSDGRYPLIQEYIPGTTKTTVGLAADGDLLVHFQEERLRTYPASGGNSALLRAVREPVMRRYAERVIGALDWTGPIMVEFMESSNGEFYLIEVNGRYWGSLPFTVASGVDIPWLHYCQLRGEDSGTVVESGEYRTDIVQRRLLYEDLKWIGEQLAAGRVGALVPFVLAFIATQHTFVDTDDPLPTAGALIQACILGIRALFERTTSAVRKLPAKPVSKVLRSDD